MYAEIIERKILTNINADTHWWIPDSGFLIMPENDDEMEALIDLVEKYHPNPEPEYCEACKAADAIAEEKHFDPNIG